MADKQHYLEAANKIINQVDAELTTGDLEGAFGYVDVVHAYEYLTSKGMVLYGLHDVRPGVAAHAFGLVSPYEEMPQEHYAQEEYLAELREGRYFPN